MPRGADPATPDQEPYDQSGPIPVGFNGQPPAPEGSIPVRPAVTPSARGGGSESAFVQGGQDGMRIDPDLMSEILRPTDRPDEPITHGLPFGPGANHTRVPGEDDSMFRKRVAGDLESSPAATSAVMKLAERLRREG